MQQFVFFIVNGILLNLLSCLPLVLLTGLSSFSKLAESFLVKDFPAQILRIFYSGDLKSRLVWIWNGQIELGLDFKWDL